MNNTDKDPLKEYLNRETFERAPEGFGLKTMTRLRLEKETLKTSKLLRHTVPLISLLVTAILILVVVLLPETKPSYIEVPFINFIQDIKLHIPVLKLSLDSLPGIDLSEWSVCLFGALMLLGILDRILSGIFNRNR